MWTRCRNRQRHQYYGLWTVRLAENRKYTYGTKNTLIVSCYNSCKLINELLIFVMPATKNFSIVNTSVSIIFHCVRLDNCSSCLFLTCLGVVATGVKIVSQ